MKNMCEYTQLFAAVNRTLIDSDLEKKRRNKRTRRYKISPLFVEATEQLEIILRSLK